MSINPHQLFLVPQAGDAPIPYGSGPSVPLPQADDAAMQHRMRKEGDLKQKERALADLLLALSDSPDLDPVHGDEKMHEDGESPAHPAETYRPVIPDEVTQYYLQRSGFQTSDVRVTRLLALAAQKFVADIAADSYHYARTRTLAAAGSGRGRPANNPEAQAQAGPNSGNNPSGLGRGRIDKSRTVLTMEDLSAALQEYGVNASRAPYYL